MALTVRPMREKEYPAVERILGELDLGHPSIRREDFWVAVDAGEVVGISNLSRFGSSLYLSAVGVSITHQGKGVATALVRELLKETRAPAYLHTTIPQFFSRMGFVPAPPSAEVPKRDISGCEACRDMDRCVSMVRRTDDSRVS